MLMSYEECINKYQTDYNIKKKIEEGTLFKIEKGIYSTEKHVPELSVVTMKYPKAVLTMNSALYMQGLTEVIPEQYFLSTDKDAAKILDKRVKQCFEQTDYVYVGVTEEEYQGSKVKIYSKERLLIEVIRNKRKLPYDYYKEIIGNYRKLIYELDIATIQEYAETFPKSKMITEVLRTEVF
ncbi:MAG: hypothetical protein IKK96_00135 [Lachnospiraceae bacterium]|nr:hypothetical protein [Lachnospiraceae bacterium]